tara:strand:- start:43 stop:249 length:207 start_codon:yes stop_codon:yes gene_type:complete
MTIQEIKADQKTTAQDMKAVVDELNEMYSFKGEYDLEDIEIIQDLRSKLNRLSNQAEELAIKLDKLTK